MADEETTPPGLAGHLQRALENAHDALAGKINDAKKAHVANVLDQFEADIAPMLAPIVKDALDNPAFPDHYRALLEQVGAPEHFSSSLLIGVAVGAIIGPVLGSAVEPFIQGISNGAWVANPSRPAPPDVWVEAVLKGVRSVAQGAAGARLSGYDDAQFGIMVAAAGQSMGFAEALLLERRKQLVGTTLRQVLEYSNVNPIFYDALLNLIWNSPGTGEVVAGVVKNRLGPAEGLRLYEEAGGNPTNFDWQVSTAGRPLGLEQMADLVNRGQATPADLAQAAAQSDLAIEFQKFVPYLREYWPPVRSILPMLRAEAITPAEAAHYWDAQGVPPALQTIFLKEAAHHSNSTVKQLTQAQIVASYENRLLDRATAHARLVALTYSDADANALLDLADEKRTTALTNATVNMVGRRYVAYKLSKNDATHALATAGVPNAAQLDLFRLWGIERSANVHVLTPSAIVGAYRRDVITARATKTRLLELGIDPADLAIVVADGWPPTHPTPAQQAAAAVVNA